ncbi:NF-kappa-B-activating protein domain-containing protein [Phthorimaea operculella]|nr:NF-kappa-B-activating protein domain-containing protein [Phthorimaea operculella]
MSSRRNGSVSRAAEAASKNRLHMDRNPQHARITDPAHPAGRRKEIDNVMKRARQGSPGTWDRKLLEVEEKDPNRWRHTGYKQMYIEGDRSVSPRRSRSRSPIGRRSRSPVMRRSPPPPRRSPPRRSPAGRRSPPPRRSPRRPVRPRSPPRRPSPRAKRPPEPAPRPKPAPPAKRPPSPPPRPSSGSGSSTGSCSDESCSVCSAKNKKGPPPPPPKGAKIPPRPASASPRRARPPPPAAGASARAVQPTRELLKAREASKRSREEKVLEWQRSQLAVNPPAALNDTNSESESEPSEHAPARLTLSERFGKMAQWSMDRSARLENMRITRRDSLLHVAYINKRAGETRDPADIPGEMDDAPVGSYPEELLAVAPAGLSWDDVRVRYDYYKNRGYLRGLTLADYVKWEDWWYKYQEWLKRERAYERWAHHGDEHGTYSSNVANSLTLADYVKWEDWWYKYQEWLKLERAYERWAHHGDEHGTVTGGAPRLDTSGAHATRRAPLISSVGETGDT